MWNINVRSEREAHSLRPAELTKPLTPRRGCIQQPPGVPIPCSVFLHSGIQAHQLALTRPMRKRGASLRASSPYERWAGVIVSVRSEEHTSELQSLMHIAY